MESQDCLDDETVLGFLHGTLKDEALARVETHTLQCETCQELVSSGLAARSSRKGLWSGGGDAMTPPELSCRFLVPLLDLAATEVAAPELARFLSTWRTSAAALGDELGWVSRRFCEALVEWLAERVGVGAIIDRTLRYSYAPETMGLLYPFIRAFGSPRVGYARMPSFVKLLNRASDVEVLMRGRNRATITYRPKTEELRERSPLICQVRRAQIAAGPTVWNLPPAMIEEGECQTLGGDRCVYQVTWVEPTRWWQSLFGGAVLAVLAWLVSGHSWLMSALAMATGVAGVHLRGARRDLRELRDLEDLKMGMLERVRRLRPDHTPAESSGGPARDFAPSPAAASRAEGRTAVAEPQLTPLPQTGQLLAGRYRLGPLLGAGGMGFVFSASDEATNQTVALKVLRPELSVSPPWVERMEREVRIARTIPDPNVCQVMSFGQVDGYCFLTMELAAGTLQQELRGRGPTKEWAARVTDARSIVRGLVAIHRAGIVHRDLSPQNILRFADGRLAIADFGLAVDHPGKTTQVAGTPHYIAPEVLGGAKVSYASDVWQLGLIMHEMLFQERPTPEGFEDHAPASSMTGGGLDPARPTVAPDDLEPIQRALRELCLACLRKDPALRPQNADAVARSFPSADEASRPAP